MRTLPLEEERIVLLDDVFEKLVEEGKAERFDFEESCKLGWKRGGYRHLEEFHCVRPSLSQEEGSRPCDLKPA